MKKLAGLLIILAVLVLGAYYAMGIFTEKAIRKNIEAMNQNGGLTAELGPYQKGLYSSDTQIKWRLHIPARIVKDAEGKPEIVPAQDFQSSMPLKIYHGPMIVADKKVLFGMGYAKAVLPIPDNYTQQFNDAFTADSIKPRLNISIFVNYLNKSTLDLDVPPFKLMAKDGKTQVDWTGMKNNISISSNQYKGGSSLKDITFNKEDSKLAITGMTTDYNLKKNDNGLFLGNVTFNLPSLMLAQKNQKLFEMSDLKLTSSSDIDKDLFSTRLSLSLKNILANNINYGPGTFEIALRNIDSIVLANLNAKVKELQKSPDVEQKKILFSMLPDLPKLFSKGAELELSDFNVKLPEGQVQGSLLLTMPKGELLNPFDLFQKIQGHAQLKFPKQLLTDFIHQSSLHQLEKQPEMQQALTQQLQNNQAAAGQTPASQEQLATMQTEKQLSSLEQAGFIIPKGTDYSIEVKLDQGKFLVNGKPYDPSIPLKF